MSQRAPVAFKKTESQMQPEHHVSSSAMKALDADGDGVISDAELEKFAHTAHVTKLIAKLLLVFSVLMVFSNMGLTAVVTWKFKDTEVKNDDNGIASSLSTTGKVIHTHNAETQTGITISGGLLTKAPLKVGENSTSAERVEVGFVTRSHFLEGLNEVKSASRKGTATYEMEAGHKKLYDYRVAESRERDGVVDLNVEVDMPDGWSRFEVICGKDAIKCPIFAVVPPSDSPNSRSLAGFQNHATAQEFDRSLECKENCNKMVPVSVYKTATAEQIQEARESIAGLYIPNPPGVWLSDRDPHMSDRRLKANIMRMGATPSGVPVYTFEYKTGNTGLQLPEGRFRGTMAQDLLALPAFKGAVREMANGYLAVDYNQLDLNMTQI